MEQTVFKKCLDYNALLIEDALRRSLSDLGIDLKSEVTGKKVLIKPNLLNAYAPEKAVTTHPAVVEAVIKILKGYDCEIWLGDSPNGVQKSLEDVWSQTGMNEVCDRHDVQKKFFEKEGAELVNGFLISKVVLDADYIINVPKFKTHGLTLLTAAVKNMFGVVPGLKKTNYHRIAKSKEDFAETLVKIAETKKPNLNIVDGIESMAGNGPSGGFKVKTDFIAISSDMHQIDLALSKLIGVDPEHVDTLLAASNLGLVDLKNEPATLGDTFATLKMPDFKLPVTYRAGFGKSRIFQYLIKRLMINVSVKPRVDKDNCVKCGMCIRICPVSVIKFQEDGFPKVDTKNCIECYCCHEACPEKAMKLKESLLLRFFKRSSRNN